MLFSVVDGRSGVAYQEYRCVYGEDAESALRFLFNAMSPKASDAGPLQGIPSTIHLDNGPVAKSAVFQRVMECLGVEVITHLPAGSDGNRTTARSKGKVERPFRTIKEVHETLSSVGSAACIARFAWLAALRAASYSLPSSRRNGPSGFGRPSGYPLKSVIEKLPSASTLGAAVSAASES